jgi:hypothetical protein
MTSLSDVKWGSYREYEGPYYHGSRKLVLPQSPTPGHILLDIVTSTEGGSPDAVNGYDRCIMSVGYIQWCEAGYYLTSRLLGHIASRDPSLLEPLGSALSASGSEFVQVSPGKWRFRFLDSRGEVDLRAEQTQLFLGTSDGTRGSWDDQSRSLAKLWVTCFANVLIQDAADALQVEYTAARMKSFATQDASNILNDGSPDIGWPGALKAAFYSFAANNPLLAARSLLRVTSISSFPRWSQDWCIEALREMTFGPGITIYPGRYNKIRSPIERHFGIDLPDFSDDLKAWRSFHPLSEVGEPSFEDLEQVQELLISLGYGLGPSGTDNKWGPKTKDAVVSFQISCDLVPDGMIGPRTKGKLLEAWRRLQSSP